MAKSKALELADCGFESCLIIVSVFEQSYFTSPNLPELP